MKALVPFFVAICCFSNSVRCETNPRPVCNTVCTMTSDPVCTVRENGDDGFKTFDNECQLEVHNCQNPGKRYKEKLCGTTFCALPIGSCGQPRTFKNVCFQRAYNDAYPNNAYGYFHNGPCSTDPSSEPLPDESYIDPLEIDLSCLPIELPYIYKYTGLCSEESMPKPKPDPSPEPDCNAIVCSQDTSLFCGIRQTPCDSLATLNACLMEMYNCWNPKKPYSFYYEGRCDPNQLVDWKC